MEYITMITKDNKTITAGLHHIEGELMNVVVHDLSGIKLGDRLTCKFERKTFHAYVLKQENFNLYLYLPIQEQQAPNERRRFYRHSCQTTGFLSIKGQEPNQITIVDISLNGFGFITGNSLKKEQLYELQLKMDEPEEILRTQITVRNHLELPTSLFRYGSQITAISEKDLLHLRKFLLHQQLSKTGEQGKVRQV